MGTYQVIEGSCHCGNLAVAAALSHEPGHYQPRACDCDFCCKHGASYLSDPAGRLRVAVRDEAAVTRYRQGSGQAEMIFCARCGVLVGACYREGERLFAAVNRRIFSEEFGDEVPASPKMLGPEDKSTRWLQLWFADVHIDRLLEH
ncbi:GFA family protein [Parahaliea mediterranea]|uniref:CENP-V/GFA domain-containing protein n=1 Tax=Parahaliea mediterranea TaxID=651086 RepID=A0A939DDF0_9GAMM|nr:hypothetical protein [Parahaliea mediterranea]MBN7796205.1 hypothetical protein [Parahaliea mediterranea]